MAASRDSNPHLLKRLLEDLNAARAVESGKAVFHDIGFDFPFYMLAGLLTFDSVIPESERSRIARTAVFEAAGRGVLTLQSYLAQVGRLEGDYMSLPDRRLVLITQVSVARSDSLPRMRFAGVSLSFPLDIPNTFSRPRAAAMEGATRSLHGSPPEHYRWVRVSTRQRCPAAASDAALGGLQLLLGLWNLCLNRRTGFRWTNGPRQPVNQLGLGPVHTVHEPSGAIHGDLWWYEPDYVAPFAVKQLDDDATHILGFSKWANRRLPHIPHRSQIEGCVMSYNRALDQRDFTKSFILLWQTLEATTNSGKESYGVTIRRASCLYRDHEDHAAVLRHLRDVRNRIVHAGDESQEIESMLFRLKGYVERMLMFHIRSGHQYSSLEEATEFLDLPRSRSELSRRLRLLTRAVQMRDTKPK